MNYPLLNRRQAVATIVASLPIATARKLLALDKPGSALSPVRAITRSSKFHWRGYYDKLLFDPSNRFVLANEVDFKGRSPTAEDSIRIGMVDIQDGDRGRNWVAPPHGIGSRVACCSGCLVLPMALWVRLLGTIE